MLCAPLPWVSTQTPLCLIWGCSVPHETNHALSHGQYWHLMGGPMVAFWACYSVMILLQLFMIRIRLGRIFLDLLMWMTIIAASSTHLALLGDMTCIKYQSEQAISMSLLATIFLICRGVHFMYRWCQKCN
jgi:hypothetical protein